MGGRREMENFHRALTRVSRTNSSPMDRGILHRRLREFHARAFALLPVK